MATIVGNFWSNNLAGVQFEENLMIGDLQGLPILLFKSGNDWIEGGDLNDTIYGDTDYKISFFGRGGHDDILAGLGDDTVYGDAQEIAWFGKGGHDWISGGDGNDSIYGDAHTMTDYARGGHDELEGGAGDDLIIGDAFEMTDYAKGGSDIIVDMEGDNGTFEETLQAAEDTGIATAGLFGDANTMTGHARGGDDEIFTGNGTDAVYGDALVMSEDSRGGDDYIEDTGSGTDPNWQILSGDAARLFGNSEGGDDTIVFNGSGGGSSVIGDAHLMTDDTIGGNDYIYVNFSGTDFLALSGDAVLMEGNAKGGDDEIHIGNAAGQGIIVRGEGNFMSDNTQGGDDLIFGGTQNDSATGDAYFLSDNAVAGNDTLYGRDGDDTLWGDARFALEGNAQGGDDYLYGGKGNDLLFGDSVFTFDDAQGGEDYLFGGKGDDLLDGGGGADVLRGGSGNDTAAYGSAAMGVLASLKDPWVNTGDAAGDSYYSIENLTGSGFDDHLIGNNKDNIIDAGVGSDTLNGGRGDDILTGDTTTPPDPYNTTWNLGIIDVVPGNGGDIDSWEFHITTTTGTQTFMGAGFTIDPNLPFGEYESSVVVSGIVDPVLNISYTINGLDHDNANDISPAIYTAGFQNFNITFDAFTAGARVIDDLTVTFDDLSGEPVIDGTSSLTGTETYSTQSPLGIGDASLTDIVATLNAEIDSALSADTFQFDLSGIGDGHDMILDFDAARDILEFTGVNDLTELLDNSQVVADINGDARLEFDLDNDMNFDDASITFVDVTHTTQMEVTDLVDAAGQVVIV